MNFDPNTEAQFEKEREDDDLLTLAKCLVALDNARKIVEDDDEAIQGIEIAFQDVWDYAIRFTDVMSLYNLMEKVKDEQTN